MLEPKYDEDTVNLGYLKKVISDTEEGIDNAYKNVSRHYASRPQPPYYKGDTWIDGNIVYTCINTRTIGLYQDSDWVTESGAKTEAETKNKTYLTQPSNYIPGDMWILQSDEDHRAGKKGEILISTAGRKEYDSDDWVNMLGYGTIKSINEVAGNLNNAINRIGNVEEAIQDGIIITFYQDTVPEGIHLGDLWYVTGEVEGYIQGKIYRYDGTNWIILNDPAIQEAFDEANEARLVADGKIQSFYSETEPTQNMGVGDLWIDLSNNNQLYRYNGTNWVAVYDTRINELVTTVETVTERVVTIETDLGEIDLKVQENTTSITNIEGNVEDMQDNIVSLQAQIDGAIQFWNGSDIPTVENYPANEWVTEADKNNHRADIYTVIEDVDGELKQGKSYRFDKVGDTWQWIELTDNELSAVQALATSKAKVFVTTPTVPYSVGDLWLNNGKLCRCKTAKDSNGSYSSSDWEIAVDYTDDTVAELAKTLANNAQSTADNAVDRVNNITNTQGEAEGKNIHIEDSAEEPFVEVELYGETRQKTRSGKNIFNNTKNFSAVTYNSDNDIWEFNITNRYDHLITKGNLNIEANTDYVLVLDIVENTLTGGMSFYTSNTVWLTDLYINKEQTGIIKKQLHSRDDLEFALYDIWFWHHNTITGNFKAKIMLCKGILGTEGDYEQYGVMPSPDYPSEIENIEGNIEFKVTNGLEETDENYQEQVAYFPLAEGEKLYQGSFLDDNGKNHERKQVIFDGTENWGYQVSENGYNEFYISLEQSPGNTSELQVFSNCFPAYSRDNLRYTDLGIAKASNYLRIHHPTFTTVTEFKTWLADLYSNGVPMIAEFVLAEPETIPYTEEQQEAWNNIKALMTYKNITNITSTAYAKVVYMRDNGLDVYETKQNAQKKYTETSEKLAEQKMTVDGVITQVSDITSKTDELTGEVKTINSAISTVKQTIEGWSSELKNTGGNNIFYYSLDFWDNSNGLEEYSDTEIMQNSISQTGYVLNNGSAKQTQSVKNGFYTCSFNYKKLLELAVCQVKINGTTYDLTETDWAEFEQAFEVKTNKIEIEFISDTDSSLYTSDLMVNVGTTKLSWSQNANETRTDTVTIGKGIQVNSNAKNTYHRIDADGNRTFNKATGKVVNEATDKGTETEELVVRGQAKVSGLLIQKVSDQVWINSLL